MTGGMAGKLLLLFALVVVGGTALTGIVYRSLALAVKDPEEKLKK
jgi:hypothetical protein